LTEFKGEKMRTKLSIVSIVMLLAVVLSACGPAVIASSAQAPQRTMNVNGAGLVYLTPDIAYINVGVHTEMPTASEAVTESNAQTTKVIAALTKAGIDPKDIRTTNFSIWPSQQYAPDGTVSGTVYMVDNTVYVTVRKLDKLGDLLDTVVKAGANSINSIQFDVADKTAAMKEARAEAVKNAKEQAQELADAAGVTLGQITNIAFYDSVPSPVVDAFGKGGGALASADVAVPIQPGQMTLTVTVSVTYELK
jgi:uncharacterized protein